MTREELMKLQTYKMFVGEDAVYVNRNDVLELLEQESQTFEWCTDCKEYDQEKHCCHRWSKVIRNTVEEMKRETCEDAISRKDILDCQYTIDENETLGISTRNVVNVDDILNAKPVQPKPKTGHWKKANEYSYNFICSECGFIQHESMTEFKYCPNCGAKMVELQERSDKE